MTTEPQGTAEAGTRLGAAPRLLKEAGAEPPAKHRALPAELGLEPHTQARGQARGGKPPGLCPHPGARTQILQPWQAPDPGRETPGVGKKKAPKTPASFLAFFINNSGKGSAGMVTGPSARQAPHSPRLSPTHGQPRARVLPAAPVGTGAAAQHLQRCPAPSQRPQGARRVLGLVVSARGRLQQPPLCPDGAGEGGGNATRPQHRPDE